MPDYGEQLRCYREAAHAETKLLIAERIAEELAPELWTFLAGRCPLDEVDDLRQDVLLAVVLGLDGCRAATHAAFWGWVYTIARNKVATRLDKMNRLQLMEADQFWHLVEASGDFVALMGYEREDLREVWAILDGMDDYIRHCLWRYHVDGADLEEIAEELGKSKDAVRMTIGRGLATARKLLKGER